MPKKARTRISDPGTFLEYCTFKCDLYTARISEEACLYMRCRKILLDPSLCKNCAVYKKPLKKDIVRFKKTKIAKRDVAYGKAIKRPTIEPARNKEIDFLDRIEDFLNRGGTDNSGVRP